MSHFSMHTPDLGNKVLLEGSKIHNCKLEFRSVQGGEENLRHFLRTSCEDSSQIRDSAVDCVAAAADVTEIGG